MITVGEVTRLAYRDYLIGLPESHIEMAVISQTSFEAQILVDRQSCDSRTTGVCQIVGVIRS